MLRCGSVPQVALVALHVQYDKVAHNFILQKFENCSKALKAFLHDICVCFYTDKRAINQNILCILTMKYSNIFINKSIYQTLIYIWRSSFGLIALVINSYITNYNFKYSTNTRSAFNKS